MEIGSWYEASVSSLITARMCVCVCMSVGTTDVSIVSAVAYK